MSSHPDHILAQRLNKLEESATLVMAQKTRNLKAKGINVIGLTIGEPDFDTPNFVKDAAAQALKDGFTKYTPVTGSVNYKQAIQEKFKRDNNLDFELNQIMVSNGAKQCIANVCLSILNPGDEVIIFAPYWVSYAEIVKFADGVPVILSAGIDQDFKVTPEQLRKTISHKTKAILFSSPCNPTGSVYNETELRALAEEIRTRENIIVISDEIYEYINFTGSHFSVGSIDFLKNRTVTINGMSKGFAMTGWRLGFMGAPAYITAACDKIQGQVTSGATSFGQEAAAVALRSDLSEPKRMSAAFLQRRDMMIDLLGEIPGFKVNRPEGAFYLFPDVSAYFGKTNGKTIIDHADDFTEIMLEEAHVGLVSGSAFGDDRCIRISYAASETELRTAVDRMKRVLATYQ